MSLAREQNKKRFDKKSESNEMRETVTCVRDGLLEFHAS